GEFNHASGDGNARDGIRGTFDALYINNHDKHGLGDRFTWRNINDASAGVLLRPAPRLNAKTALHYLWLANKNDAIYTTTGVNTQWKNATSSRLGPELDFQALWSVNRHFDAGAGIARLWSGEYLRRASGYSGSTFTYLMLIYRM